MNITELRYFVAAAEYGSFSKAAEMLYTTQSNISKHISKLENELTVLLFDRRGSRVIPTEAGKGLLRDAENILQEFDALSGKAKKYESGECGRLVIGSTHNFDSEELTDLLKSGRQKYPHIEVSFKKGLQAEMSSALLHGEVDLLLTTGVDAFKGFPSYRIAYNRLMLAVPDDHELASHETVNIAELEGYPIVFFRPSVLPVDYDAMSNCLREHGIYKYIVAFCDDLQSMLYQVITGNCVAFVMEKEFVPSDKIRKIYFDNYEISKLNTNLYLVWREDNNNPALSCFLKLVKPI